MPRYLIVILAFSTALLVILSLWREAQDQFSEPQLGPINVSEELDRLNSSLTKNDPIVISNAISRAGRIDYISEVQGIALAIWRLERHKYPTFAWSALEDAHVRIHVAQLLLQIERGGYRTDINRLELLDFVREQLDASAEFSSHIVALTLGAEGNESDVGRLLELGRSRKLNAFENAVFGLSLMCFESALAGLDELKKEVTDRSQLRKIAEGKARIIENRKIITNCAEVTTSLSPPPRSEIVELKGPRLTHDLVALPKTMEEFKIALTKIDHISTQRILGAGITYIYAHEELPSLFLALWEIDREKYPSFAWDVLKGDLARVEVADTLLKMGKAGRINSVYRAELLEFLRDQLKNPETNSVEAAAGALSANGDATDLVRLKALALSPHYGLFKAGAEALSVMCSESAAEALDDVEKATREPRRLNDILYFREYRLRLEKDIGWCQS